MVSCPMAKFPLKIFGIWDLGFDLQGMPHAKEDLPTVIFWCSGTSLQREGLPIAIELTYTKKGMLTNKKLRLKLKKNLNLAFVKKIYKISKADRNDDVDLTESCLKSSSQLVKSCSKLTLLHVQRGRHDFQGLREETGVNRQGDKEEWEQNAREGFPILWDLIIRI